MSDETVFKAGKMNNGPTTQTLVAVALIVAGLALLAINVFHIHLGNLLWPAFIIGPGMLLLWPAYKSTAEQGHALSFLAVPGGMVVAFGGLVFVMSLVSYWDALFYAWPLVLAGGAAGYAYMNRFDGNGRAAKGHRFIRAMVIASMGLAAFFEVIVFHSLGGWWPLLFVVLGIYLLLKNRRKAS